MLAPRLLRTRVARRILLLFLVCAVIPVVSFAAVGYYVIAGRLEADARQVLRDGSKTAGQVLFTRLQTLASRLAQAGATGGRFRDSTAAVFHSVLLQSPDGQVRLLAGASDSLPRLSARQQARLASGGTVLVARGAPQGGGTLFLVTEQAGAPGTRLWGVAPFVALVGLEAQLNPAPPGTELCVLDAVGAPLSCGDQPPPLLAALRAPAAAEHLEWRQGGSTFLVGRWQLFLGNEFVAPSWTVALSMPREDVLVPLADFRRVALLGVALAGLLVFFLSHAQLRRRMTPLAELESGVRRIREGDFATPVSIRSGDEFELLAESFNGMARDLRRQFSTLEALHAVDLAALEVHSTEGIVEAALESAPELLEADVAAVAHPEEEVPGQWLVSTRERGSGLRGSFRVRPDGTAPPEQAWAAPKCLGPLAQRLVIPVRHDGRVRAILLAGRRSGGAFSDASTGLARQLADQLAVGLSNVTLLRELSALSEGSMLALARTIDANSPWTAGHSERVTRGAQEIGRRLGLDAVALDRLRRGGLLHDIGKIGIPAAILDKAGALTEEERAVIQSHPTIGAEIIEPIAAFRDLVPLVRWHHELLDGSGYPEGLRGDAIPDLVRILTVADVFDALVSDRPYRPGLAFTEALRILQHGAGRRFDSRAVEALTASLAEGWTPRLPDRRQAPAEHPSSPLELVT